jgi:hypothetical protein
MSTPSRVNRVFRVPPTDYFALLEGEAPATIREETTPTLNTREINAPSLFSPERDKGDAKNAEYTKRPRGPWHPTYAHPWPDELPGLGPRHVGPFDPCVDCGRGSWARYGSAVLCCPCAVARAGE